MKSTAHATAGAPKADRVRLAPPGSVMVSVEQALGILGNGEKIHTFDAHAAMFSGCDMPREQLAQDILASGGAQIVVGNHRMAGMGHNLLVQGERGAVFVEVDAARMAQILAAQVVSS